MTSSYKTTHYDHTHQQATPTTHLTLERGIESGLTHTYKTKNNNNENNQNSINLHVEDIHAVEGERE